MVTITIDDNEINYEIEKDTGAFNLEEFENIYTSYFKRFDYVVGDISYSKLRLKGFYDNNSKYVRKYNNIKDLDKYLENNCAYMCKYFVLKKTKNENKNS